MDSEKAKELNRIRWGDSLNCRLITREGVQVAECKWNSEPFVGRGKNNLSALKAVFQKINELGNKENTIPNPKRTRIVKQ